MRGRQTTAAYDLVAKAAKLLTKDGARTIALNIAKLPELVRNPPLLLLGLSDGT